MQQDTGFGVLTGNNIEARSVKAGSVIFREGDPANELFVIKSGQVRIQIGTAPSPNSARKAFSARWP